MASTGEQVRNSVSLSLTTTLFVLCTCHNSLGSLPSLKHATCLLMFETYNSNFCCSTVINNVFLSALLFSTTAMQHQSTQCLKDAILYP